MYLIYSKPVISSLGRNWRRVISVLAITSLLKEEQLAMGSRELWSDGDSEVSTSWRKKYWSWLRRGDDGDWEFSTRLLLKGSRLLHCRITLRNVHCAVEKPVHWRAGHASPRSTPYSLGAPGWLGAPKVIFSPWGAPMSHYLTGPSIAKTKHGAHIRWNCSLMLSPPRRSRGLAPQFDQVSSKAGKHWLRTKKSTSQPRQEVAGTHGQRVENRI